MTANPDKKKLIAATASILGVKLLTTDNDFKHLDDEFIDLELVVFE